MEEMIDYEEDRDADAVLIAKNLCHVFRCIALSSAAGRPLFHVPADVRDFGRYILYSIFAVRLKIRNFHMIVCIFIAYASNHGWPTSANHLTLRKLPDSWASSARQTESCHTKITLKSSLPGHSRLALYFTGFHDVWQRKNAALTKRKRPPRQKMIARVDDVNCWIRPFLLLRLTDPHRSTRSAFHPIIGLVYIMPWQNRPSSLQS